MYMKTKRVERTASKGHKIVHTVIEQSFASSTFFIVSKQRSHFDKEAQCGKRGTANAEISVLLPI